MQKIEAQQNAICLWMWNDAFMLVQRKGNQMKSLVLWLCLGFSFHTPLVRTQIGDQTLMFKHDNLANFHLPSTSTLELASLNEYQPWTTLSNNFELIHEETTNIHFIGEISLKSEIEIQNLTI